MLDYRNLKDLTGLSFGNLTVLRQANQDECTLSQWLHNNTKWLCRCGCGRMIVALRCNLTTGHTRSCGCSRQNKYRLGNTTTLSGVQRLKSIWYAMRSRCYSFYNTQFKNYGGRGIKICKHWLNDFDAFYNWSIQHGYSDDLTIDRIDSDGDYTPDNCRWITLLEQQSNRHDTIRCESGLSLRAECRKRGLNYSTVRMRYKNGYSIKDALEAQVTNKFYYGGKTMSEWCTELELNVNKIKTRMCRHKETFRDALLHYAAGNNKLMDLIRNLIPNEKDSDKVYPGQMSN